MDDLFSVDVGINVLVQAIPPLIPEHDLIGDEKIDVPAADEEMLGDEGLDAPPRDPVYQLRSEGIDVPARVQAIATPIY